MPKLLVRVPSPLLADGELTHLDRVEADPDLALSQWRDYVAVYRDRGWQVIDVPAAPDQPDGVFIEDALVIFDDIVVIGRPGAEFSRVGRTPWTPRQPDGLGWR